MLGENKHEGVQAGMPSLDEIERKLKQEAEAFQRQNRSPGSQCDRNRLVWVISGLTGLMPDMERFFEVARDRLMRLCAAEMRKARCRNPGYDINRHLSLKETLQDLDTWMNRSAKANGAGTPAGGQPRR